MIRALAITALAAASCGGGDDCDLCGVTDERTPLDGTWEFGSVPGALGLRFSPRAWTGPDGQVWAVAGEPGRGLVAHFDGTAWSSDLVFRNPPLGVWASAADDVWVTEDIVDGDVLLGTAVLQWDGATWTEARAADGSAAIGAIWGAGRGDPWFVHGAAILHPAAGGWTSIVDFGAGDPAAYIAALCATSPDDAWVAVSRSAGWELAHLAGGEWTADPFGFAPLACADGLWGITGDGLTFRDADGPRSVAAGTFDDRDFGGAGTEQVFAIQAVLARSRSDVWIVATRTASSQQTSVERDELWHFDGARITRLVPGSAADDSFSPQAIGGTPDGPVWILGENGRVLRYTP